MSSAELVFVRSNVSATKAVWLFLGLERDGTTHQPAHQEVCACLWLGRALWVLQSRGPFVIFKILEASAQGPNLKSDPCKPSEAVHASDLRAQIPETIKALRSLIP